MKVRGGMAIVVAILVLLLIEAMTAGMIALATHARMISASQIRTARAQAAARRAIAGAFSRWSSGGIDSMAVGQTSWPVFAQGSVRDEAWALSVERLDLKNYLVSAKARVGGSRQFSDASATAVLWTVGADAAVFRALRPDQITSIADTVRGDTVVVQGTDLDVLVVDGLVLASGGNRAILPASDSTIEYVLRAAAAARRPLWGDRRFLPAF